MILPERVLGRPGANWITSGLAMGDDLLGDEFLQFLGQRVGAATPAFSVT